MPLYRGAHSRNLVRRSRRSPSSSELLPRWAWPVLFGATLVIAGAAIFRDGRAGGRFSGPLILTAGAAIIFSRLRKHYRAWRDGLAAFAARRRRQSLLARRRERAAVERERRRDARAEKALAADRTAKAQEEQRTARRHTAQRAESARAALGQAIDEEADRLRSLSENDLRQEVADLFDACGIEVLRRIPDSGDFELRAADGGTDLARCVPIHRKAAQIDLTALEEWRASTGARHAYLISLSGFAAQAVVKSAGLPITLVEAYQMAQWRASRRIG
jgi:hypothetical protein